MPERRAATPKASLFLTLLQTAERPILGGVDGGRAARSEEHTSELQSLAYLVCRLLLEKKNTPRHHTHHARRRPRATVRPTNPPIQNAALESKSSRRLFLSADEQNSVARRVRDADSHLQ